MTPYSIRQRRENLSKRTGPEAYPGQNERLLEALIESDQRQAEEERERAAEALHGGRYITGALARVLTGYDSNPGIRARFAGEDGPEQLAEVWRYTASPSGSVTDGRDTTQRYAQSQAASGGVEWEHSAYWKAPMLPEGAVTWPIYVEAMRGMLTDEYDASPPIRTHGTYDPDDDNTKTPENGYGD